MTFPISSGQGPKSTFVFEPSASRNFQTIPGVYGTIQTPDTFVLNTPSEPKSSLLSKAVKGTLLAGATILGGVAFNRFAPNAAATVASYIPGLIKKPFNYLAGTGFGSSIGQYAGTAVEKAAGLIGKLLGKVPSQPAQQAQGMIGKIFSPFKSLFGKFFG